MERDLSQAADIQGRMLPEKAPDVPGADLAGFNMACRTVGGDYYDFFTYPDGRVALALGDVSGKGMPASLMMMALQARVQVLAEEPGNLAPFHDAASTRPPAPSAPATASSRSSSPCFNAATGRAAPTPTPATIRRSWCAPTATPRCWKAAARCWAFCSIAPYSEMHAQLNHGDMLVLYSDGVTEANNPAYDEFGEERFIEVLRRHRKEPAAEIVEAVTRSLTEFTAGAPQADDITLAVAKRL